MSEQAACACDTWICPHNEEKIKHLPGVVNGIAFLKDRIEEMRRYWQESEAKFAELRKENEAMRGAWEKVRETCAHYEGELSRAKAGRDRRVYELTEVAYLASLREHLFTSLPATSREDGLPRVRVCGSVEAALEREMEAHEEQSRVECKGRASGPCEASKVDPRICRFCFIPLKPAKSDEQKRKSYAERMAELYEGKCATGECGHDDPSWCREKRSDQEPGSR